MLFDQMKSVAPAAGVSRRGFLKAGGVMDDGFIDSYIELKMEEVMRLQLHPHPVEFDMYFKC